MVSAALPELTLFTATVIDVSPPPPPDFLRVYCPREGVPVRTVPVPDVAPVEALMLNVLEPDAGLSSLAKLSCVTSVMVQSSTANAVCDAATIKNTNRNALKCANLTPCRLSILRGSYPKSKRLRGQMTVAQGRFYLRRLPRPGSPCRRILSLPQGPSNC